jgi:hypothetical protein
MQPVPRPERRPLRIFAVDPMVPHAVGNRTTITVPFEDLAPGPKGARLEVIDYDGENNQFYEPVNLDHPSILVGAGLEPSESDPRFHQQMTYAVAMRVLENFDRALGRVVNVRTRRSERLRLFPHAFCGANAYYDRDLQAVLFGFFRADRENAGGQLIPGQTVFSCLSHDIVSHEVSHALVHRLRPYFLEATNPDVLAFHEGFSDLVALFQHFSFRDLLREEIQGQGDRVSRKKPLAELARQFGYAIGSGKALRSALDDPKKRLYSTENEPHARGAILVAALFDGFFSTYQSRIRDLIRIATGGTGTLPRGDLHPDLVTRIANEVAATAQSFLNMSIRAIDYLPPIDVTFGDYLRAFVTADRELHPDDAQGLRTAAIEGFRRRGIFPDEVTSLAEESLTWPAPSTNLEGLWNRVAPGDAGLFYRAILEHLWRSARPPAGIADQVAASPRISLPGRETRTAVAANPGLPREIFQHFHRYASRNAAELGLAKSAGVAVSGFHPTFRVGQRGEFLVDLVIQYTQRDRESKDADFAGVPERGGVTVIASLDGAVKFVIKKPLQATSRREDQDKAAARIERQRAFVEECDAADPRMSYYSDRDYPRRHELRTSLRAVHAGL